MNDYSIIREIGKGGMGCVYEAVDTKGTHVALKMMSAKAASHPDYHEMFNQEVTALRSLSNPAIVRIVDEPFSDASGNLFLPMELVVGDTIAQIVQKKGTYTETQAISVFCKLLDAFSYIHRHHCIHRDVKPSNIMIRPSGDICVIDFGIAKDSKTSTGKTIGRVVGTDGYMSPEQANGYNIDTRTDIYSLGCLLHYMLTGEHAIKKQQNDYDTICAILENNFPLVSEKGITISQRTQDAILKAVDKNMTLRFQTAEEFKTALCSDNAIHEGAKITVGRNQCDVTMSGAYVSGKHLDIIWQPCSDDLRDFNVTICDHSTNGTGVNGKKIKHENYAFHVNSSIVDLMRDSSCLPNVLIAGLPEFELNWSSVLNVLYEKMNLGTVVIDPDNSNKKMDTQGNLSENAHEFIDTEVDISAGYAILCFLIPLIGWGLGFYWKKKMPKKAKSANRYAFYGFLFNLVSYIINVIITL